MKAKLFLPVLMILFGCSGLTAQNWSIDESHSSIYFKVTHVVAPFVGEFEDFSGTLTLDTEDVESAKVEVVVKAASVEAGGKKREELLKSDKFFDAKAHPDMIYKSTKITMVEEGKYQAEGEMTFLGITQPVTVDFTLAPAVETGRGLKSGAEASCTFKRSDFGCDTYAKTIGDEVTITAFLELNGD